MNHKAGVTPVYLMLYKFKHSITYMWEVSRWIDGICNILEIAVAVMSCNCVKAIGL